MVIGFDFDGTLTNETFGNFLKSVSKSLNLNDLIIITSRGTIDDVVRDRAKELELKIKKFIAMGNTIHLHKADFVKSADIKLDLFFDNDPYDVEAFRKLGILCLFIPPDEDSLMEEICEGFMLEKCRELDRVSRKQSREDLLNGSD